MRLLLVSCLFASLVTLPLSAQQFTTSACDHDDGNGNNSSWFSGHQDRVCEKRHATLPLVNSQLSVTGSNGGIELIGEDRQDISLEARVVTQAPSREEAQSLAGEVKILTAGDIHAEGPHSWGPSRHSWSVSFRLRVPRHLEARLRTENGGIQVANVDGVIHAETTNGGLKLDGLSGDVHATTVNGGMDVKLNGDSWRGAGLFASATNGGVSVQAPDNYSAHLIATTVNGGVSVAFPITVTGKIGNHIDANIGHGGPTVEFQTTNGGVSIQRD
jgi:DUF4097 and DUF4098 domain-containing protein YvlB